MKKWQEFEKLAAKILEELSPHAQVKWDDRIYGHETQTLRQIDVSIRANLDGHDVLTIVQAKDWRTSADIKTIDEFASVIRDVKAQKGILVCRSGFTKNAKVYAQNLGIELTTIHDAQSRNWNLEIKLPILWIEESPLAHFSMQFSLEKDTTFPTDERRFFILSQDAGQTVFDIWSELENLWNERKIPTAPGTVHSLDFPMPLYIQTLDKNEISWQPLESFKMNYAVNRQCQLGFFKPEECRGLWNYLENIFTVSHLPLGQLPERPETGWIPIEDGDKLAITTNASLVVCEGWKITYNKFDLRELKKSIQKIE